MEFRAGECTPCDDQWRCPSVPTSARVFVVVTAHAEPSVCARLQEAAQQAREGAETLAGQNQALRRQLDELERAQAQAEQAALAAGHLHRERTEAQLGAVS